MITTKNYLSTYAKSFYWSGFFLPKSIFLKCSILYDFCRTIDNIADQNGELETKKKSYKNLRKNLKKKIKMTV